LLSRDQLAKIHIAKKALCLGDDDYRDILERITGKRSARDVAPEQLQALQRELRRLGWDGYLLRRDEIQPLPYMDCENRPGRPNGPQLRMLEAMFKDIKGYADVSPDEAFRKFLEKRFGISHARLLDDTKYEAALTAVKRLQKHYGVKRAWKGSGQIGSRGTGGGPLLEKGRPPGPPPPKTLENCEGRS
jgi:hypothetical protein